MKDWLDINILLPLHGLHWGPYQEDSIDLGASLVDVKAWDYLGLLWGDDTDSFCWFDWFSRVGSFIKCSWRSVIVSFEIGSTMSCSRLGWFVSICWGSDWPWLADCKISVVVEWCLVDKKCSLASRTLVWNLSFMYRSFWRIFISFRSIPFPKEARGAGEVNWSLWKPADEAIR